MQGVIAFEAPSTHGFRPIRVWGSVARQRGIPVFPGEVVRILRASFMAMVRFGAVVPAGSLWVSATGEVKIVSPDQDGGFTSPAWCLEGLGLMACELLAGAALPDSITPGMALHLAKEGATSSHGNWDPALGFLLERMLGMVAPYQSIHDALMELDDLYLGAQRPVLGQGNAPLLELECIQVRPEAGRSWVFPAAVGSGAATLLLLVAGGAFWLGSRRTMAVPPPVAAPAPAGPSVVTLDPALVEALKQLGQPRKAAAPQERHERAPGPAPVAMVPLEDDGPVRVGGFRAEPYPSPNGQTLPREGSGRVKSGDFVARR